MRLASSARTASTQAGSGADLVARFDFERCNCLFDSSSESTDSTGEGSDHVRRVGWGATRSVGETEAVDESVAGPVVEGEEARSLLD